MNKIKTVNAKITKLNNDIVIRCLTKPYYGLGHFRRCLTLANELQHIGYQVHFIVTKNKIVEKELQNNFQFFTIPSFSKPELESKTISDIINTHNYEWLIIDMREFGENISKELMNKIHTVLIDDAWTKNVYSNLIFNGTMIKKYHNYHKINKNSKIFTGTSFFIIDKSFLKHKKKSSEIIKKKQYNVTISTGGTDPNNVTLLVIKSIISIPNINIKIVIGPYSKSLNKISQIIKNKKNVQIILSPKKIWNTFKKADIIISNAGSTLFELATQNIPTLSIAAEEHQISYAKFFSSKGFSIYLGFWRSLNSNKISKILSNTLYNRSTRIQISKQGHKIIDGKGVINVAKEIDRSIKSN